MIDGADDAKKTRRKIGHAMKARIALAAVREEATTADLARQYQVETSKNLGESGRIDLLRRGLAGRIGWRG